VSLASPTFPVAVIGVGNMGAAMAENLLVQGWPVQVCDVMAERAQNLVKKGAISYTKPRDAAMNCEALVVAVVDQAQTEAVLFGPDGAAHVMQRGQAVLLCPTLAPEDVQALSARLAALGIDSIDAPMSGGPARAREGSMSLMVACKHAVFERHSTLIGALSSKVFRISERAGDGARTKLVNNLAAGINLVAAAEVLALAQRMGLNLATTQAVIEQSSGQSWIGTDRMARALADDLAPRAHVRLLEKDTRLALLAAQRAGFVGPLGAAARDVFAAASAAGWADRDDAALLKWLMQAP
jgi:L-threonate 2-dehydrogenase